MKRRVVKLQEKRHQQRMLFWLKVFGWICLIISGLLGGRHPRF